MQRNYFRNFLVLLVPLAPLEPLLGSTKRISGILDFLVGFRRIQPGYFFIKAFTVRLSLARRFPSCNPPGVFYVAVFADTKFRRTTAPSLWKNFRVLS